MVNPIQMALELLGSRATQISSSEELKSQILHDFGVSTMVDERVQMSILGDYTPSEFTDDQSSLIAGAVYNVQTMELCVDLKAGAVTKRYTYSGVPAQDYVDFYQATSRGAFFNRYIRTMYSGRPE